MSGEMKPYLISCPWCGLALENEPNTRQITHLIDCGDRRIGSDSDKYDKLSAEKREMEDSIRSELREHLQSPIAAVDLIDGIRQLAQTALTWKGNFESAESKLQEVRGELERERNQFCIENERLRGELDSALDEGRKRIRLLEQKNQALEEVIAGYRKPEIL